MMFPHTQRHRGAHCERGAALGMLLHVILVLIVLGQVVYLASRYRVRVDMTSDQLWTSTNSTRTLIEKLEEKLVVEAYFSPKDKLPVSMAATRDWADNFLDELVQLGKGRVVVQRFDPNSDKAVAEAAVRLGIEPLNLRSQSATSLSVDQHWQGLRLLYGGGKQKVVESFVPGSSFLAEALVVPKIKEVMTAERTRFGYMEWPAERRRGRQVGGVGWNRVRTNEGLKSRYEFQNVKDEDGALLPDEFGTLFLFRPKDLNDRQRYVIDQFLMGGGTVVIFADAAEYRIGQERSFSRVPFAIDAKGSKTSFIDQLRHYGVEWKPRVVCDMETSASRAPLNMAWEYMAVPMRGANGMTQMAAVQYPYFFHARNKDWREAADLLARDVTGNVDQRLADQYRKTLKHGMPTDDFLLAGFKKGANRGPGFYWPTWVGLRERAGGVPDLPDGVEGRVLMWSSPMALLEDPPVSLDPIGRSPQEWERTIRKFMANLGDRVKAEARQQAPLMAEVKGNFTSYFAGRERPKRPSQIQEEKNRANNGEEANKPGEDKPGEDEVGPQPAKESASTGAPQERAMRTESTSPGHIVIVGDATFLRDDVLTDYKQIGGPFSGYKAMPFFAQMLDWLSGDRDLVELQTRVAADRTMKLVDANEEANPDPRDAERTLRQKTSTLVWLNVVLPCIVLSAFGIALGLVRRNQKRAFLASVADSGVSQ